MSFSPVKGMHDIYGEDASEMEEVTNLLKEFAKMYAYKEFIPPIMEYTDVFSRGTGESSDIVRKEMYTFLDKGNRSVTLRPEFTAGLIRGVVSNKLYAEDLPLKYFYCGPAFRYERPQLGRYRQFNQFGVECVGADSPLLDAETIIMAVQSLCVLGFENVTVKINSLGDEESRKAYREALKKYFSSYMDEMCEDCHERINLNPLRILDCKVEHDQEIAKGAPKIKDYLSEASEKRFYKTISYLNDMEIDYEIDENLVRGLDYYSEIVFEIHVKSKAGNDYGAVCGGGHYGGLVKELGGPDLPGVGFAMGVERIVSLLKDNGLKKEQPYLLDFFFMPVGGDEEVINSVFYLMQTTRLLGYSADMAEGGKFSSMFKKAERKKAKFAFIVGSDELEKGVANIKNIETQEQITIDLNKLDEELDKLFEHDECECDDENCECHHGA